VLTECHRYFYGLTRNENGMTVVHSRTTEGAVLSASTAKLIDREAHASRLLNGSSKRSYDPAIDIDWRAPIDPDKFFLPEDKVTLYGTPLWKSMNRAQQIELSREELANMLSMGIWFENMLIQALARRAMRHDPTASHTHYSLTEMGDETRHMVMFGRVITTVGAKPYRLTPRQALGANMLATSLRGTGLWVAALIGEEIFDQQQREVVADNSVQPIVLQLMRIHVLEESRHISFARQGVMRNMTNPRWVDRVLTPRLQAFAPMLLQRLYTNSAMYRRTGLDPIEARTQALTNPAHLKSKQDGFAPLAAFLTEHNLMPEVTRNAWIRAGFLTS
jgi:hypothetical protein